MIVPYGGGGLLTGIASAIKASRPDVRFYAVEPETGAPVSATLATGIPAEVDYVRSFVDGAGSRSLIPGVWEHASTLIDGAFAVPLDDAASAIRTIAERMRVIAEGAGALAVATAMEGKAGAGTSSASSRAGTSIRACSAGFLPARPPDFLTTPTGARRRSASDTDAMLLNGSRVSS